MQGRPPDGIDPSVVRWVMSVSMRAAPSAAWDGGGERVKKGRARWVRREMRATASQARA